MLVIYAVCLGYEYVEFFFWMVADAGLLILQSVWSTEDTIYHFVKYEGFNGSFVGISMYQIDV